MTEPRVSPEKKAQNLRLALLIAAAALAIFIGFIVSKGRLF